MHPDTLCVRIEWAHRIQNCFGRYRRHKFELDLPRWCRSGTLDYDGCSLLHIKKKYLNHYDGRSFAEYYEERLNDK